MYQKEAPWPSAQTELLMINAYKVIEKELLMKNAYKVIEKNKRTLIFFRLNIININTCFFQLDRCRQTELHPPLLYNYYEFIKYGIREAYSWGR